MSGDIGRRQGGSSPKRARLGLLDDDEATLSAKAISASLGESNNEANLSTKATTSSSTLSPTWLPPLLPSHTTALQTVPHPASPPYGRHGLPPTSPPPSHPKPPNRASLANLINPDPAVGFSILQDPQSSSTTSRSPFTSPPRTSSKIPFSPVKPLQPFEVPSPRRSLFLPPLKPQPHDTGYVHETSYNDDGGVNRAWLGNLVSRQAADTFTISRNTRAPESLSPRRSGSLASFSGRPTSSDPEMYIPKDQAWFSLGRRPEKEADSWTVDRIGGYNDGFTDAVEAVKGGVIGVNGNRYSRPIFWRPEDPNRSLAEADLDRQSSRSGLDSSSGRRPSLGSGTFTNDIWATQYGGPSGPSMYPYDSAYEYDQESKLSPETKSGKRLPISCYPCRKRKLKCDGNVPCGPCVKRDSVGECGYEKDVRRRGKGKKQLDEADWVASSFSGGPSEGLGLRPDRDHSLSRRMGRVLGQSLSSETPGTRPFSSIDREESTMLETMDTSDDERDERHDRFQPDDQGFRVEIGMAASRRERSADGAGRQDQSRILGVSKALSEIDPSSQPKPTAASSLTTASRSVAESREDLIDQPQHRRAKTDSPPMSVVFDGRKRIASGVSVE